MAHVIFSFLLKVSIVLSALGGGNLLFLYFHPLKQ